MAAPASAGGQGGASWTSFLKSIASFTGDLASLTAPPFILSSTSLTEFSSYWCEHPAIFAAPAAEKDAERRMVLVLKWFLSTLKQQYASRSEQFGNEKKPLNPFLGELFLGYWQDEAAGRTELVSEQVSHHPPATAYSITNVPTGVHLEGYNAQKATFSRTIHIKQLGHAILSVPVKGAKEAETYLITLPNLHIEGLIYGAPFIELNSASYITSSSGLTAKVGYSGKGWLSGEKNSVTATVYRESKPSEVLYNVVGVWTKNFSVYRGAGGKSNNKDNLVDSYDAATSPMTKLTVADDKDQHPLESRRAWRKVATAIQTGDMELVSREKGKIEQAQRDARAREKEAGTCWERRYFTAQEDTDAVLEAMAARVGLPKNGDGDKTGGLWRFDRAKEEKLKGKSPTKDEVAKIEKELLGQTLADVAEKEEDRA